MASIAPVNVALELQTYTATPPTTTTATAITPITTGETSMPLERGLAGSSSVSGESMGRGDGASTAAPGVCVLVLGIGFARWGTVGISFARWGTVQFVTEWLPAEELDRRGQSVHTMLARASLYIQGGQTAHDVFPAPVLYALAGQGAQTCPSRPVKPCSQVQSSFAVPATAELEFKGHVEQRTAPGAAYCPGRHPVHEAFPGAVLNVPAWHGMHVPPLSPVKPGAHVQAACVALANTELEFGGQLEHAAAPRAAYFPARNPAQEAAPASTLKVLASHGAQVLPFAPM